MEANPATRRPTATTPGRSAASDLLRELFETDCEVFFVFNGTAANSLALASLCQTYHSIICHELAHVETDECGAPEFFSNGTKVLPRRRAPAGKLDARGGRGSWSRKRTDIHYPKPRVVTLTQATELGTVYRADEVRAISAMRHAAHGLQVHMDGARFANAVASLGVAPSEITWQAGVDVLCFGGTKNGMPVGEAVVFFDRSAGRGVRLPLQAGRPAGLEDALPLRALGGHARGRRLAAPRRATPTRWRSASHAGLRQAPGVEGAVPGRGQRRVLPTAPQPCVAGLRERGWRFYTFIGAGGAASCAPGIPSRPAWTRCSRMCARWRSGKASAPPPSLRYCRSPPDAAICRIPARAPAIYHGKRVTNRIQAHLPAL